MPNDRRRQRSVRLLVASLLLVASAVFVAVAVAAGSRGILVASAITAVVVGVAAVRIVADEVMATRRAWYGDRAEQAQAYRAMTMDRTRENMQFIDAVNETLSVTTKRITELTGTLRLAETRADEADARRTRTESELEKLRAAAEANGGTPPEGVDLADLSAAALWDGADVPTIVDLLNWEANAAARSGTDSDTETDDDGDTDLVPAKEA